MEALTKQNDVYRKRIAELNEKLKVQAEHLAWAKKEYGENSDRVKQLQTEYNKTQTQINQYNAKIEQNNKLIAENSKKTDVLKTAMVGVGAAAAAAAAALAAAAAVAVKMVKSLANMAVEAGKAGDELLTMSKTTGLSTDELQKYQFAADRIDVSLDTITGSMTKLTRNMSSASKGSGSAAQAFKKLGVAVTNSDGSLRDRNEVFKEIITQLGTIENVTERDALAMEIFGKSAQDLNPLIMAGADALDEFAEEAEKAGLILNSSQLANLGALNDAMDRLSVTWEKAKMLFASSFSGEMATTLDYITDAVQRLTSAFAEEGLEGAMREFPKIVDELASKLESKMSVFAEVGGEIISALAKGISALVPVLVPSAINAINTLAEALVQPDTLKAVLESAGTVVVTLATGIIKNLPMIVQTAWELIKSLVSGLASAIFSLIPEEGRQLIKNFIDGIKSYFSNLFQTGKNIISEIGSGVKQNLSETWKWGKDLIDGFIGGIKQKWQDLKNACSSTAKIVKNFLGFSVPEEGPLSDADTYGPDFMRLYSKGITDNAYMVKNAVNDVAQSMTLAWSPDVSNAEIMANATSGMENIMADNRNQLENLKIYLSTGQLVGGIAPQMNNTLGYAYVQDIRGAMA